MPNTLTTTSRTSAQIGSGLSVGLALALLITWVLGRTIGLSQEESTLLSASLTAIFSGAGAFLAPYIPTPKPRE